MLAGDKYGGSDKSKKDKDKKNKKKSLLDEDSDDSIGGEYGRRDMRDDPRKSPFSSKDDRGRGSSPFGKDKSRSSPFDK